LGRGLAELLLSRGHHVVWCGRSTASLAQATEYVFERLARVMDDNQLSHAHELLAADTLYNRLIDCEVIIEAVAEEMPVKRAVLTEIEKFIRSDAILATNTSGLSIDELAQTLAKPGRFGALHFFNPPTPYAPSCKSRPRHGRQTRHGSSSTPSRARWARYRSRSPATPRLRREPGAHAATQ